VTPTTTQPERRVFILTNLKTHLRELGEWIAAANRSSKPEVVCPHCHERGHVHVFRSTRRVDGRLILSIEKPVLEMRCDNSKMKWVVDAWPV
jgi:hypothetical protein